MPTLNKKNYNTLNYNSNKKCKIFIEKICYSMFVNLCVSKKQNNDR